MTRISVIALAACIAGHVYGSGVPVDSNSQSPKHKPYKVAVIGAGAGGTSAALWLSKAKTRSKLDIAVDVYERSLYVGGRSTVVHPSGNKNLPPLELGASIFVPVNLNLMRAKEVYNLNFLDLSQLPQDMSFWNGEKVFFQLKGDESDSQTLAEEYGLDSLIKHNQIVEERVTQYLTLYLKSTWDSLSNLVNSIPGWKRLTRETATTHYNRQGISSKFTHEFIEAILRVNYAQGPDDIHALEGVFATATGGAVGIDGGVCTIFENFLADSGAKVYLNTAVKSIFPTQQHGSQKWSVTTPKGESTYDAVILAAPFHQTGIQTAPSITAKIPRQPYVHLHVTLLTTTSLVPNSAYFNLPPGSNSTHNILTVAGKRGRQQPEFISLTYHGEVRPGEHAFKFFSLERVSDNLIRKLFKNTVTWVYRKEWDSYPELPPTDSFPPIKLQKGLYYVNAMEPLMSTMETQTIASRNVVDLLFQDEFDTGICPSPVSTPVPPNFVYGWDC